MRRSKRRTTRRYLSKAKRMCIRHTWLLPLILALTIVSLYLVYPYPSNPLSACLFLSYPLARDDPFIPAHVREDPNAPTHYGKGGRDFAFVGFYIIVLSFTREFCMQRLIRPIALHFGIKNRDKQSRFMEQAYTALYFGIYGPFGIYIMSRTPVWYFNTIGMYENFPHRTHEAIVKAYYLLQASYWAQQAIVLLLMLEKPRKDFKELVAHHVITVSLIWLSYRFHFTYMGIAVYITHDISDFFLAVSQFPTSRCAHLGIYTNATTDIQVPKLHRFAHRRTLLLCLHVYLGLHAPLHQSQDHLLDSDYLQNCRPFRAQLGNPTIQVLD